MPKQSLLLVANWKMHGTLAFIEDYMASFAKNFKLSSDIEVVFCPPSVYLNYFSHLTNNIEYAVGAQNIHFAANGAHTGEISAQMVADIGAKYVIIGHSERRGEFAETDELIAKKILLTYLAGLNSIVCIGESKQQRDAGEAFAAISQQLMAITGLRDISLSQLADTVAIAYEPIWAIGTGDAANAEEVVIIHQQIREFLAKQVDENFANKIKLLYGGSVNVANAQAYLEQPNVDGCLIGGASLDPQDFKDICYIADKMVLT